MDMQQVHERLLNLAIAFDEICRENGVEYTLHGGSLLGAIREKGFIPWDDEMDIAMTRQEYNKLCLALKNNSRYYIAGSIKKQFRITQDNSIWIDIFICDHISEKPAAQKAKYFLLTVLDIMNRDKHTVGLSNLSQYSKAKQLLFKCCYLCGKILPGKAKAALYEKVAIHCFTGSKKYFIRSNDHYQARQMLFPTAWMEVFAYVPFVTTKLPVTTQYHSLLLSIFGEDYMTPKKYDRNSEIHDIIRAEGDITL